MLRTVWQAWQQALWSQRVFVVILSGNIILILAGILVVPATITTLVGVGNLVADVCMQAALAMLAFVGPWSFRRLRRGIGISLVLGAVFALVYDGTIFRELLGFSDDFNLYLLFAGVAFVAGVVASYHTHRFSEGLLVAIWALVIGTAIWSLGLMLMNYATWGTHQWYGFWLGDGAIDDFHRSGSSNLNVFLLQDLQGALFFHPLLSIVLGAVSGLIGTTIGQGIVWGQRLLKQ